MFTISQSILHRLTVGLSFIRGQRFISKALFSCLIPIAIFLLMNCYCLAWASWTVNKGTGTPGKSHRRPGLEGASEANQSNPHSVQVLPLPFPGSRHFIRNYSVVLILFYFILFYFIFILFYLLFALFGGHTCSIWKFPSQGQNGSCSCQPIPQPQQRGP